MPRSGRGTSQHAGLSTSGNRGDARRISAGPRRVGNPAMTRRQLAIVGAGPAGLAAAIAAAEGGLRPTVIDENPRIGGQIYRQAPAAAGAEQPHARHAPILSRFEGLLDRIELCLGTTAWGLFPPKCLAIHSNRGSQFLEAE